MRSVVLCGFLLFPQLLFAAVSVSEVAWMGTVVSPNHEWIELYNAGSAVDVTGWTVSDGLNFSIDLAGIIPAESYVVLERTSDDSAPGAAFLLYTGALVNSGGTLYIRRADGSLVDQVSGGEDWQHIGGDNVTKETAQYTTVGWVTAPATPGRGLTDTEITASAQADEVVSATTTATKTVAGSVIKKSVSEPVRLVLPGVTLRLSVIAQTLGYVHQPIAFSVTPSGIGDTLIDSLSYEWNFGDGETALGQDVTHVYRYPGTYVVTVYAGYKRQEQVARHEITILPVMLSLSKNTHGDMQVNNDSPYELDLSGYRVKGDKEFVFSPRTIILPNQTITIAKSKVGTTHNRLIAIYDTEAALVASTMPNQSVSAVATNAHEIVDMSVNATSINQPVAVRSSAEANLDFSFSTEHSPAPVSEKKFSTANTIWPVSVAAAAASDERASEGSVATTPYQKWPYVALVIILLLSSLGLLVVPRKNQVE